MKYTFDPKKIPEHRFFFRMLEKLRLRGIRPCDIFFLDIDDLKQMPELTKSNLLIILQLKKMFKEGQANGKRKCRIYHN